MSTTNNHIALDPLTRLPASSHRGSINNAVGVFAPLLCIDADSPQGDQLRQHLTDTDGPASAATLSCRPDTVARQSPRSAALVIMPTPRRRSAEPSLASQREDEWRAALAASGMPE
jgi:hypothetical protein